MSISAMAQSSLVQDGLRPGDVLKSKGRSLSGSRRLRSWRRGPGSNRRIKVLQTSPLPLGYRALGCLPHGLRIIPFHSPSGSLPRKCRMERETRLELATLALARRCSTTELLPLNADSSIPGRRNRVKPATSVAQRLFPTEFTPILRPVDAARTD